MAQQLKAHPTFVEDLKTVVSIMSGYSQLPVTQAQGDPLPSPGLQRHCKQRCKPIHTHAQT